ncbi:MAG: hypothetical protein ACPG4T_12660 [Nannocystaceae bacterium]
MAARKKKKTTRKKAAKKTAPVADNAVTDQEREFKAAIKEKMKADRQSFLDGYKAAKIEAFLVCVGKDYDKTKNFIVSPSVSRVIAPILEEYLDANNLRVTHERPFGSWSLASTYIEGDDYKVRFKNAHEAITTVMAKAIASNEKKD